ncbi:hypothetical protein WJX79_010067 [Trebouxia sp. C0005]
MGCVVSSPAASKGSFTDGAATKAGAAAANGLPVSATTKGNHGSEQAPHQNGIPYLPVACGDICKVMSPWPGCGKPANETERLAATEKLRLIGKEPNPALQRYVDLISTCYQRGLVLLSLFDANCAQIINTSAALPFKELSRQYTPCAWALVPDAPEVLMIEDLTKDARFKDFHVVAKPPHIRSYIGTPIVLANGYRVGVLCALDTKPHAMAASSTRLMVNVAGLVAREIEGLAGDDYDLPLQPKVKSNRDVGLMVIDTSRLGWTVLHADCNNAAIDGKRGEGQSLWDLFKVPDVASPESLFEATLAEGVPFKVKAAVTDPSGFHPEGEPLELEFRPGDGTLPKRFVPVGTQVGTPAWVPDEVEEDSGMNEEDTGVAKHWFVHLRRTGHKASEKTHSKMDTAGHTSMKSSRASSGILAQNWPSGSSIVSVGTADVVGGWDDVEVGYLLGRGSSGSVYRAKWNGKHVAVKIIAPEQDKYIKRTPDGTPMEVALTQDLDHPNIVRTLRHASFQSQNASLSVMTQNQIWSMHSTDSLWGEDDNVAPLGEDAPQPPETWLMLEFCDRGSLLDAVDRGWLLDETSHFSGVLGLNKLLLTALELAKALAYLHRLDIMHGDLTGGNVMLHSAPVTELDPRSFTVKVADFGLSRIYSDPKQTATQGTITHMPPELVRKGVMHKSADVWAFGVLLWEMYSGQRAWAGMSYTQVMQAVGYEQRGPEWPDQAPTALKALGNACFELDPDARPTFNQCIEHLSSMLAACGDATRAESLEPRSQTRPGINANDIPDVLLCTTQAPIHTEADLAPLPNGTAVAA